MATDSSHVGPRSLFSSALLILLMPCGFPAYAQGDRFAEYDLEMYVRPNLPVRETFTSFPDGLMELWLRALERPDVELTRLIVDSISLAHHRGLRETTKAIPKLIELANAPDQTTDVARAIAAALIELDVQDEAETLAALAVKHGSPVGRVAEPALIKWKSPAMESVWLERLHAATATESAMILAMDGLGARKVSAAAEQLKSITQNVGKSISMRLAAARALGRIESSGNVEFARQVAGATAKPSELGPLIAIAILASHTDAAAIELLKEYADHPRTAVQAQALARLFEIDYLIVDELAPARLDCPDVNVRRWLAKAFVKKRDADRVAAHCRMLGDANPSLRREVANALVDLAQDDELRGIVLEETMNVLGRNEWQGCEQACVVLTRLDHRPAGERMVELLAHDRVDVQVAAAWGLMKLRVAELLPAMLDHAYQVFEQFDAGELNDDDRPGTSLHVALLFLAFGDQRYPEASDLMTMYIPKRFELGVESRPAAIWALGMIHEGEPPAELIRQLIDRMSDGGNAFGGAAEATNVQRMAAISLGRMKATEGLDILRVHVGIGHVPSEWAIHQMTGEEFEIREPFRKIVDDWILSPAD